ncbi:hypothetical protein WJX81_003549 [Elliptochloris bilobata]|uniref:Uncharacterized protein n=1 Tax=Elliptochloris bilobata TaxID=381761 RepID=A0AAW1SKP8_9CHLO
MARGKRAAADMDPDKDEVDEQPAPAKPGRPRKTAFTANKQVKVLAEEPAERSLRSRSTRSTKAPARYMTEQGRNQRESTSEGTAEKKAPAPASEQGAQ